MSGTWISTGKQHFCSKPDRRERRRMNAGPGARWRCACGQLWEWHLGWDDYWLEVPG